MDAITPFWKTYFPDIDIKLVLTSSHSPYADFFNEYSLIADEGLSDEELHTRLKASIVKMQEENKDLLEAMQRDSSRS